MSFHGLLIQRTNSNAYCSSIKTNLTECGTCSRHEGKISFSDINNNYFVRTPHRLAKPLPFKTGCITSRD